MQKGALWLAAMVIALVVWGFTQTSPRLSPAGISAMQKIDAQRIRAHVKFLSDDMLEGRGTGQRGGDMAAEYIAKEFKSYGLMPAGDNGTYLQKVPMVGVTPGAETTFSLATARGDARNLKVLDEYVAYDQTQQSQSDVDADIVFVGYGIDAPEYQLGRLQRRGREGQSPADAGERAAVGRSEIFQRQGAHLLRPLDLQV